MELTTIYNELDKITKNKYKYEIEDYYTSIMKLKEKIEQVIRDNTCYKTTPKTRLNAIKRIAAKNDGIRPVLAGYGIYEDYKMITDSYHAVMIKGDCPLKLVSTDKELIKKYGEENCIYGEYPKLYPFFETQEDDLIKIELDYDDIMQFYKLHKKTALDDTYEIKYEKDGATYSLNCNIVFLKNIIDVIGKDADAYICKERTDVRPIFLINKDNEKGLVLPIKKY